LNPSFSLASLRVPWLSTPDLPVPDRAAISYHIPFCRPHSVLPPALSSLMSRTHHSQSPSAAIHLPPHALLPLLPLSRSPPPPPPRLHSRRPPPPPNLWGQNRRRPDCSHPIRLSPLCSPLKPRARTAQAVAGGVSQFARFMEVVWGEGEVRYSSH